VPKVYFLQFARHQKDWMRAQHSGFLVLPQHLELQRVSYWYFKGLINWQQDFVASWLLQVIGKAIMIVQQEQVVLRRVILWLALNH